MNYVLHPELLDRIPFRGAYLKRLLQARAETIAAETVGMSDPDISVVIRTKNDRAYIKTLFADLKAQNFSGSVQLILVDTMSNDGTVEFAQSQGAEVISISQPQFSYPKALNLGFQKAKHPYVMTIVGHSSLTSTMIFKCVTLWSQQKTFGGVFGFPLSNWNASLTEKIGTAVFLPKFMRSPHALEKPRGGLLAANSAVISRAAWQKFSGFDESYAAGGEDSALGKRMLADGMLVAMDPVCTVYHSHGLGPINNVRQFMHWFQVAQPLPFKSEHVHARRPDLRKKL